MLCGLRCHQVSLYCISMSNNCGHINLLILLGRDALIQSEVFSFISLVVIFAAVMITCYQQKSRVRVLRTFAPKSSHAQIFLKLATQKGNDTLLPKRQKKLGVTDFVLERTCPEKYPKSKKLGCVS